VLIARLGEEIFDFVRQQRGRAEMRGDIAFVAFQNRAAG